VTLHIVVVVVVVVDDDVCFTVIYVKIILKGKYKAYNNTPGYCDIVL